MTLLAVDIGGTKVQLSSAERAGDGFVIEPGPRNATAWLRRGTPRFLDDLIDMLRPHVTPEVSGIALTLNGVLAGSRVVYSSLMGGRVDVDLAEALSAAFARDVFVDDDLHAMGIAEGRLGAGSSAESVCILNVGTGVGAVHYERGDVVRGRFGAGLISEIPHWVPELGEHRILDRITCGRGVAELYGSFSGTPLEARLVFERYVEGDEVARQVIEIYARTLGWLLGAISRFYNPEVVTILGSLARSWEIVAERVDEELQRQTEHALRPRVIQVSELTHAAELGVLEQGWGSGGRFRE